MLVLVLVLVLTWLLGQGRGGDPQPSESPQPTESTQPNPSPSESATADPDSTADPAPTGCLAGPELTAEALLLAQERAPHSANGAVEATMALARFIMQRPYPSLADQEVVQRAGIAEGSSIDLVTLYEGEPVIAPDAAPESAAVAAYSVGGAWLLDSYTEDRAIVSVAYYFISDGRVLGNYGFVSTYVLKWQNGWQLHSVETPQHSPNAIINDVGTPFTGGC